MNELDEARAEIRYLLGEHNELFVTPVEDEGRADLERIHNERIERIVGLLAAARPTPDAEAMEREEQAFRIELDRFALCAEKASIWYPTDEYHPKRTLERDNKRQELIDLFRKAVSR